MKVFSTQRDLSFALEVVSRAINPNNTLPVLNNILIKTEGKKLHLFGTNLEIAAHISIPVDVTNEGAITIPARLITSYISLLQDEKIELKTEEGHVLHIKTKTSETKIKGISADEFPLIPKVEKEYSLTLKASILAEAIEQTIFSAAVTPMRPILAGVYFQTDKNLLKLVATDSYRLSEKKIKLEKKTEKPFECIVPLRTLLELSRILAMKYKDELVEVQISKNQILFAIDGIELTSRLIEGRFPDYEKIIPRAAKTKLEIDTGRLALATKRVCLFARENNNNITITATNDGKLVITTDETRVGEERAEIDMKITGENNKIALNAEYFLEGLNHIRDRATIEIDEKLTPIIMRQSKTDDFLYLIMPLKV